MKSTFGTVLCRIRQKNKSKGAYIVDAFLLQREGQIEDDADEKVGARNQRKCNPHISTL